MVIAEPGTVDYTLDGLKALESVVDAVHRDGAVLRVKDGKLIGFPMEQIKVETRALVAGYRESLIWLMTAEPAPPPGRTEPQSEPVAGGDIAVARLYLEFCTRSWHAWEGQLNNEPFSKELDRQHWRWNRAKEVYCALCDMKSRPTSSEVAS